jgi:tetratricopeptide (TPR) repeat protein
MQLDPTRWLVSAAGFGADWVISREWSQIGVRLIPVAYLTFVASVVFMGSRLDPHKLASKYLELGEQEIADWEKAWTERAKEEQSGEAMRTDTGGAKPDTKAGDKEGQSLSRFAEVLFRRKQLLEPNLRSQFIIGVTLAQRGAIGQAMRMLSKIAPDDRPGYEPAHAWITQYLLSSYMTGKQMPMDAYKVIRHHFLEAMKWDLVPESVLESGSALLEQTGEFEPMMQATMRLAELNPMKSTLFARRARLVGNARLEEQAIAKAQEVYAQKLSEDPRSTQARFHFIELKVVEATLKTGEEQSDEAKQRANEKLEEAHKLADEGLAIESSPTFVRVKSELFRFQFRLSMNTENGQLSANIQLLDKAFKQDPTNPMVAEEIARLARVNGPSPGEELISVLQEYLAEGKATAITHALISELYLLRKNFAKALPHLEQVVMKMDTAPQYMNNLAYVLAELHPQRIDEALKWARRAVELAPSAADFHDTLAKVLTEMNRNTEAIVSLETAIELQPQRIDFHERVSQLYQQAGNTAMAAQHQKFIAKFKQAMADAEQQQATAAPKVDPGVEPVLPDAPPANIPELPFDSATPAKTAQQQP